MRIACRTANTSVFILKSILRSFCGSPAGLSQIRQGRTFQQLRPETHKQFQGDAFRPVVLVFQQQLGRQRDRNGSQEAFEPNQVKVNQTVQVWNPTNRMLDGNVGQNRTEQMIGVYIGTKNLIFWLEDT